MDRVARDVCIVGAGAIGGWLADAFDRAGWHVSMVARGDTLAALRTDGLQVVRDGGVRRFHPRVGNAAEVGPQDYVFLTVKAQSLSGIAPQLAPLLGPATVAVSGTNGIPWWFFENFGGPLENVCLSSVDPQGTQAQTFAYGRVLGSVAHASARVTAPARVEVVAADRFILGEPGGGTSERVRELVAALKRGGINAEVSPHIRDDVWTKLWGNMNISPLSALTRCGTGVLLDDPDVRALCERMMGEMQHCGKLLGLNASMAPDQRIAITRRLGDFRPSMLVDLEAGRELELSPQLGAVVEIAERLGVEAPFCRAILGLLRLLNRNRGL